MATLSVAEQKQELRKALYKRRADAAAEDDGSAGQGIADRIVFTFDVFSKPIVSAFLPIRTEINTRPMIDALTNKGIVVVLPTIENDNPNLIFRPWHPGDPLEKGAFDVEEPLRTNAPLDPDIMVVPLLAFDRKGYRLGYGGGYYDRAIARLEADRPVTTIGIAYDEQEADEVPREAHDRKLTVVVTPTRTIHPEPS